MMRAGIHWMRVVLPEAPYVSAAVGAEMVIEVTHLILLALGWFPHEFTFRTMRMGWLGFCALAFGISRVLMFHPVLSEDYLNWLKSTPWTADKPLPGGPIQQAPQDLVVLVCLMLLSREMTFNVLRIPVAFLVGYYTMLAIATRSCGGWAFAYLLGFGLGAIALAAPSPVASCVMAMACYPLAYVAIRRSLRGYPWETNWKKFSKHFNAEELFRDRLGWPHDFMSPRAPALHLPYADGICLSLLAGWYAFVVQLHAAGPSRLPLCLGAIKFLSIVILVRLATYISAHRPPISFWGRFRTLQWIVPKYDIILAAPILAGTVLFCSQLAAITLLFANGPIPLPMGNLPKPTLESIAVVMSSAGITVTLLLTLVAGPRLEHWRLYGAHRIVFDQAGFGSKHSQSQFVEV